MSYTDRTMTGSNHVPILCLYINIIIFKISDFPCISNIVSNSHFTESNFFYLNSTGDLDLSRNTRVSVFRQSADC